MQSALEAVAPRRSATPPLAATTVERASAQLGVYRRAPVSFVRGEGVTLYDADGTAYLDFTSGIAVNALGYGDPGLTAALHAAATGLVHVSNLYGSEPAERLAHALCARSFASRVFFCNSGAEANEGAFKFVRRWGRASSPSKHEIIALRGSFHGRLFGTLAATDRPGYRMPFRPLAGGISISERDLTALATQLEQGTTAAVILEPVQGEGGVRVLDRGWVAELRALTRERDVALIFDEIQCGMGRTGSFFAYERLGVVPDVVTLAKPLAGGLPMGAVLMTDEIAAVMEAGDHGTTFGGGPFVASVALHLVERLSDPTMLAHVREAGAWLGDALAALAERSAGVRAVRGAGLMWGIDTTRRAAPIVERALELGLLVCSAGDHTVRLLPPLVIGRDDLRRGVELLEDAIGSSGRSPATGGAAP